MSIPITVTAAEAELLVRQFCAGDFDHLQQHLHGGDVMRSVNAVLTILQLEEPRMTDTLKKTFQFLQHALNPANSAIAQAAVVHYSALLTTQTHIAIDLRKQVDATDLENAKLHTQQALHRVELTAQAHIATEARRQVEGLQAALDAQVAQNAEMKMTLKEQINRNTELAGIAQAIADSRRDDVGGSGSKRSKK